MSTRLDLESKMEFQLKKKGIPLKEMMDLFKSQENFGKHLDMILGHPEINQIALKRAVFAIDEAREFLENPDQYLNKIENHPKVNKGILEKIEKLREKL